jgi:hypothetical protein
MNGMRKHIAIAAALASAATFGYATPAAAQATRTWVSGVGDDVNPCSRTAPCKTFAGAISKTAAGGEINCLDPGGFGAVSIVKSMTISCPYTEGGALAGGNGITFNMPATTDVGFIRGLDIFGVNPPTNGIRFVNNGSLHVHDTVIRRFNAASSRGISYQPSGPSELYITDTIIAENGNAATGGGILIQPTGTGNAIVTMRNVKVHNNAGTAIQIDSTANTGTRTNVIMDNVSVAGNNAGIVVVSQIGTTPTSVLIRNSTIFGNGSGITANGGTAAVRSAGNSIFGNSTGVTQLNGGAVFTHGENINVANPDNAAPVNGTFTGAIVPPT